MAGSRGRGAHREGAQQRRALIRGYASYAHQPEWFTTAPVPAAKAVLKKVGWSAREVDLWEVNEAFAVVPMAFMQEMDLSPGNVNIHGGACALGHPIGASGARFIDRIGLKAIILHEQASKGDTVIEKIRK